MIKISNIILFIFVISFFEQRAFAETRKDCSQYSTKTWVGLTAKLRCKKGLPPVEKNFLESFEWKNIKSKKISNPTYIPGKPCNEYSTKTLVGLMAKMKCKKNQ